MINKLLVMMVFLLLVIVMIIIRVRSGNQNIVLEMKDGLENPDILEYYKQDIKDVKTITNSKMIYIKYYDVDLNEDGLAILLHEDESYKEIFSITIPLMCQDVDMTAMGEMYILNNKTNGFYDIKLSDGQNIILLKYADDIYSPTWLND